MTLTQELRRKYHDLWHRMVTHPFVVEMGDGTLPVAKFRAYFLQDYVFVHDLVAMTSIGLAKAPSFLAANQLHQFLAGIFNPENDLFVRAFTELGVPEEKVVINIERFGNTTAATIPLALSDAVDEKRLKRGDLLLMVSVGAGFTVGSLLLKWGLKE